jgi:hypothetical protein
MTLFSQRKGLKPVKSVIQVDSMNEDLRNSLWNALVLFYFGNVNIKRNLLALLWVFYFKKPIDLYKSRFTLVFEETKKYFFSCEWYEVYDLIEFIANNYPDNQVNLNFMQFCNSILERESSAYRFVSGIIAPITSEIEIAQIEESFEKTKSLKGVHAHLKRALELLSDRKDPDYRNSIKESISAVESICKLITGEDKATLGKSLEKIEKEGKIKIHPALKKAFENLYGYTSDAEGIRHGLLDEPNLDFEDAKFMLVSCSAFVNFLIGKASKFGIKL